MSNPVLNLIFDKWNGDNEIPNCKGMFPNSLINNFDDYKIEYLNSIGFNQIMIDIKKYNIHDAYLNPDMKFYYFICHGNCDLKSMFSPIESLSLELRWYLKLCDNINVVYQTHHESDSFEGYKELLMYIRKYGFKEKNFHIINNNSNLKTFTQEIDSQIDLFSVSFLPHSAANGLIHIGGCNLIPEKNGKFFMTFNKGPKLHRFALLTNLMRYRILSETNWSFIPNHFIQYKNRYKKILNDNEIENLNEEINYFNNLKLKVSDYESEYLTFNEKNDLIMRYPNLNVGGNPELPFNYENSYINITTESDYFNDNKTIHITEKSLKPFFYYQIPIFLATTGHIKKLKERYDFDFFDDIIDNTYDNEIDDKKRFKMIIKEIVRLNDNKEMIKEFYKNNLERFEENKEKVVNIGRYNSDYLYYYNLTK